MKNYFTKNLIIFLTFVCLYSCEKEIYQDLNTENQEVLVNNLEYNKALELMRKIHQGAEDLTRSKGKIKSESPEKIIKQFWVNNNDLLGIISNEMDLKITLESDNLSQFGYYDQNQKVSDLSQEDIINSQFLNDIQKKYALDLYFASKDRDINKLTEIKDDFKIDLSAYPELEIFNLGIALIDYNDSLGIYDIEAKGDCYKSFIIGATVGGLFGIISGAVSGGIKGAVIGGILTGGTLTIPAGAGGAVIGAVVGGLTGYISGGVMALVGCWLYE